MRRFLTSMMALSFLTAVLGCKHTAGVCDCDCCEPPCGPAPVLKPEPLQQMPKVNGDSKPAALPEEKKNGEEKEKEPEKDN